MLVFNFGFYAYWEEYNPLNKTFGTQKVVFDGPNKLILVSLGVTSLDVKVDIYSAWKEWLLDPEHDNAKYLLALGVVGGDPITADTSLGDTYFLENGWRLKPYVGDYVLDITGNIYTREAGQNPVVPTSGVSTSFTRSALTTTTIAGGSATESRLLEIWRILGLDGLNGQTVTDTSITVGDITLTISQPDEDTTTVVRT